MAYKYLIPFTFILFITSAFSLYDNKALVTQLNSYDDYIRTVFALDHVSVFLFYREDCDSCERVEPIYYKVAENMHGLIKAFAVDCDELWSHQEERERFPGCDPKIQEALPHIMFFEPPSLKINPYTKRPMMPIEHRFDGSVSPKYLMDFAKKWMPAFRKKLTTESELESFLADNLVPNKVILFTNKEETSPLYKGITSEFRDRLDVILLFQGDIDKFFIVC